MPRPRADVDPAAPKLLEKALRVLDAFGAQTPEWSEAELRRELAIPSTTLNRILRCFEQAGYLFRDEEGRYRLGIAAIHLGTRAGASLSLPAVLAPAIHDLAQETGELAMLAVPEFDSGLVRYIATSESSSRLRVSAEAGTAVPSTAGATAKATLAFQSAAQIESVLERRLEPLAAGTVTDPEAMRRELAAIRTQGWAFSWEETFPGAWAVAAPLLDPDGRAFAAIGVAAPTTRHTEALEREFREAVIATAARAHRKLGPAD